MAEYSKGLLLKSMFDVLKKIQDAYSADNSDLVEASIVEMAYWVRKIRVNYAAYLESYKYFADVVEQAAQVAYTDLEEDDAWEGME